LIAPQNLRSLPHISLPSIWITGVPSFFSIDLCEFRFSMLPVLSY
jgi:hypothetical protein